MALESSNSRYDSLPMREYLESSKSSRGGGGKDKKHTSSDEGWTTREVEIGKGLSAALQILRERGVLKRNNIDDWGGRNVDKRKWSKFVANHDDDHDDSKSKEKEISIERRDEFGRIMTPKEAFRMISHKFHGKGPGKKKQEKRMKQYQQELKSNQMKINDIDTPSSLSLERMREAQRQLKMPYLLLSGSVKPTGFANGDRKVVRFSVKNHKP